MAIYASESRRFQFAIIAILIFLYCGYRSWNELQYAMFGQTTRAVVMRSDQYTLCGRGNSREQRLSIEYKFTEPAGAVRIEKDDLLMPETAPSVGSTIDVQFRPDSAGESRFAGHDHLFAVVGFLLMMAGGLVVFSLMRALKPLPPPNASGVFEGLGNQ